MYYHNFNIKKNGIKAINHEFKGASDWELGMSTDLSLESVK